MKANAPEKLYFFEGEPILSARSKKVEGTDIEYTRTDILQEEPVSEELREVDFEHELSKYVSNGIHRFFPNEGDDYYNMDSVEWQDYVIETAKHFFELGLKVQKEGEA